MIKFPDNWDKLAFGDFADISPKVNLKKGQEYSFIPMEDLDAGYKFAKAGHKKIYDGGGAKFCNGDTLFARITPCLENGKIAQATGIEENTGFGSTEFIVFRGIKEKSDSNFVYYLSKTDWFKQNAVNSMVGASGRQRADAKFISNTILTLPPLPIQQKITAILSAYDDLIENNLKQIKLLEEMAQITYEEWFVRFKFPNHENTPVDEVTGLPLGWERKKLGDLTSYINRGISPSYVESDGFSVINQKCIRNHFVNFEESRLTSNAKSISEDKQLKKFDILINSTGTGTLGRIAQLFESINHATVDTHVTIVRAGDVSSLLLGRALEHAEGFIESLGKGATNQQELSRTDLAEIVELVVPSQDLQNKYDELAMPIYDTITFYRKQNQLLKEARDILLPRLMTGKIAV